jgi:hypothetical protein
MLQVPADIYSSDWAYIYTDERPETGIIQKVEYQDTAQTEDGVDTVLISGFFLECRMNDFTFLVEESEIETYYVDPPSYSLSTDKPTLYSGTDGYLYVEKSGVLYGYDGNDDSFHPQISVSDGTTNEDGTISVSYDESLFGGPKADATLTPVTDYQNVANLYFYYQADNYEIELLDTSATGTTLNASKYLWDGTNTTTQYTNFFTDVNGSTWYTTSDGSICRTTGVTAESAADTYQMKMKDWKAAGGYERYRTVKGAWQRLELDQVGQEMDNIQQLYIWVRLFFQNSLTYAEPTISGEVKTLEPSLKQLGDLMWEELQTIGASFRVVYNFEQNTHVFEIWQGKDRTQSQNANPWAVFSDTWGSLRGFEFSRDESNYKNKCYVLYEYDEPEWDGSAPKVATHTTYDETNKIYKIDGYYIPYTTQRSYYTVRLEDDLADAETVLDLRDENPTHDSNWSRDIVSTSDASSVAEARAILVTGDVSKTDYTNFKANLKYLGKQKLENDYSIITNLNTGTLNVDGYMEDFDLGDKVDMNIEQIGVREEARIIGVSEVYESGNFDIQLEIGDELVTLVDKANLNG